MSDPIPVASPQSSDDLEDLFQNAPCGYLVVSPDGKITKANRVFSEWIGMSSEILDGMRLHSLLSISSQMFFETHLAPLLQIQGHFSEVALDMLAADGVKFPVLANASVRRSSDERLMFTRLAVFKAEDRRKFERELITARAKTEAALQIEQDSARLREQFIAVLGHDLRNPLASIDAGARMLRREPLSEKSVAITGMMQKSVQRMAGLINNVLDFARGRLGGGLGLNRRDEDIEPIVRQVIDELQAAWPERKILVHCSPGVVNCDRSRLGQLLSNLTGNALTYGSTVGPVEVVASITRDHFTIAVSNPGETIPQATLPHLFKPFERGAVLAHQQGLGLGLYISSEIAKAHGGSLTVISENHLTTFKFTMPIET